MQKNLLYSKSALRVKNLGIITPHSLKIVIFADSSIDVIAGLFAV